MSESTSPIEFEAADLFFSTTDGRGVIQKANSVFVRLSGYSWDRLVGAPHNIIRHDDMPGGAFKLMWQTLQAGEPFCAYVVNSAADGRPYTVFATITPLGDGYLSVRSRPCVDALRDTAFSLYAPTRQRERELLDQGHPGPEAAQAGLEYLAGLLQEAGLSSYTEFIQAALPAEVEARSELVSGIEERSGEGPLVDLLGLIRSVEGDLTDWTGRMVDLAALTQDLTTTAADLHGVNESSRQTAAEVTELAAASSPIMLTVNVWVSMLPEIESQLKNLQAFLAELSQSCAQMRFRIALARLHNDATGAFVTELIDAGDQAGADASGVEAILDLNDALYDGVRTTARESRRHADLAEKVAAEIEAVSSLMQIPLGMLDNWQSMVASRTEDGLAELAPKMAEQITEGDRVTQKLTSLASTCRQQVAPLNASVITEKLVQERDLLDEFENLD